VDLRYVQMGGDGVVVCGRSTSGQRMWRGDEGGGSADDLSLAVGYI
jgi:hypothetical protein